jgi:hypothetical protein
MWAVYTNSLLLEMRSANRYSIAPITNAARMVTRGIFVIKNPVAEGDQQLLSYREPLWLGALPGVPFK